MKRTHASQIAVTFAVTLFIAAGCSPEAPPATPSETRATEAKPAEANPTSVTPATEAKADAKPTETKPEADKAWAELQQALVPPMPPAAWRTNRPSEGESKAFRDQQKQLINTAIDKASDFQKQFPQDERAARARQSELELTRVAAQMGDEKRARQVEEMEEARLKEPGLDDEERFALRAKAVQRTAMTRREAGEEAVMAEFEKGARELMKEFPKRTEPFEMLLEIAASSGGEKAKTLAKEIADHPAAGDAAKQARSLLTKLDAVGRPVDIKFKAVDGRDVDLASFKGKVVLVDFWATWCGPCRAELPNLKAAYAQLHEKGFEIVGISLDEDKDALVKYVADNEIKWPQAFDGKGWQSELAQRFGINSIPAMWLVDKKGLLREQEARGDLPGKVEKLLAED